MGPATSRIEAVRAPLYESPNHFSASPELVGFGADAYQRRSPDTSDLLRRLFERFHEEGFAMSYTMEDFRREVAKENFAKLTPKEQEEALQALPPERRLAGLSPEQIRQYLERLTDGRPTEQPKPRRKR